MNRPLRRTRRLLLVLLIAAAAAVPATATAGASSETGIEGVWTFNGGQIAVQRQADGAYTGTVVSATRFAECTHEVGEQIWTAITEQRDGSFWGLHQWFEADCKPNPKLGPTAWRVLQEPNGSRYMRVCFSHPDTSQPTISANGEPKSQSEYAAHGVSYGCDNSALIAPLPTTQPQGPSGSGSKGATVEKLSLPSAHLCLSATLRQLKIQLKDPQYDPFKTVVVTVKGRRVKTSRHGSYVVARINLSHLHGRSFTVKVKATTVLGHKLSTSRTYHRCAAKHKHKRKHSKKG